jgi:hypothetical protein
MHNTLRNHEELDKAMISALNYQVIILKLCWKWKKYFGKERNTGTLFVTTRRYFGKLVLSDFTKNALEQFKSKIE